ncbi:MAG: phage tail protein, partial [Anaerolineales bacterium]|nr:phage tail protein [Anaerolineales bacterium]
NGGMYSSFVDGDRYWLSVVLADNTTSGNRTGHIYGSCDSFSVVNLPKGEVSSLGNLAGPVLNTDPAYGVDFTWYQYGSSDEIALVIPDYSEFAIKGIYVWDLQLGNATQIAVTDDLSWWKESYPSGYPSLKLVSFAQWENYKEKSSSDEIKNAYSEKPFLSYTEEATISSVDFNSASNQWEITLTEQVKYTHKMGDVLYLDETALKFTKGSGAKSAYYAYLIADHPVYKVSNIKVNGSPIDSERYSIIEDHDGTNYYLNGINAPQGKAYILLEQERVRYKTNTISGSNVGLSDTTNVKDDIEVEDSIWVDDQTHEHIASTTSQWNYQVSGTWQATVTGLGSSGVKITVVTGSVRQIVVCFGTNSFETYHGGGVNINTPWAFTSSSTNIYLDVLVQGTAGFNHLSFQGSRTDPVAGTTTFALGLLQGNPNIGQPFSSRMTFSFPAPPGASATSKDHANVQKAGDAKKKGVATKTGSVSLTNTQGSAGSSDSSIPNITNDEIDSYRASDYIDVRSRNVVTCDVVGFLNDYQVHSTPQDMVYEFINKYARNPIVGTEGSADIVEYSDWFTADDYFTTGYNMNPSIYGASTATLVAPNANAGSVDTSIEQDYTTSPSIVLGNTLATTVEGAHVFDIAITEPQRFRDIVSDMLLHGNMSLHWRNGIAQVKHHPKVPVMQSYLYDSDVVMQTGSVSRSSDADLATEVTVRYDYSPEKDYQRQYEYLIKTGTGQNLVKTKLDATRRFGSKTSERLYDLPMIRDQISAEIVAERIYDKYSSSKYRVGMASTLNQLALEPGDDITVEVPIFDNSVIAGVVEGKTLTFGSAIDLTPDLISLDVAENHVGEGAYKTTSPPVMFDPISMDDSTITLTLNDSTQKFKTLSDAFGLSDSIHIHPFGSFSDSMSITELLAFEYQMQLTDLVSVDDPSIGFTGILFWSQQPSDAFGLSDNAITALQDGVYVPLVYTDTDTVNVGVFI